MLKSAIAAPVPFNKVDKICSFWQNPLNIANEKYVNTFVELSKHCILLHFAAILSQ